MKPRGLVSCGVIPIVSDPGAGRMARAKRRGPASRMHRGLLGRRCHARPPAICPAPGDPSARRGAVWLAVAGGAAGDQDRDCPRPTYSGPRSSLGRGAGHQTRSRSRREPRLCLKGPGGFPPYAGGRGARPLRHAGLDQFFDGVWPRGTAQLMDRRGRGLLHGSMTQAVADTDRADSRGELLRRQGQFPALNHCSPSCRFCRAPWPMG